MIYLDAAAIVKMIRVEAGSATLQSWLQERTGSILVSSALIEVEVPRALRRNAPAALAGVPQLLTRLFRFAIDEAIRTAAGGFADPHLRSLDAIHLATAQALAGNEDNNFQAFVTYDKRLLSAAEAIGLPVASPGG